MTRRMSLAVTAATGIALTSGLLAQPPPPFQVHEATIAGIHAAMKAGRLTCRGAGRAVPPPHRRLRQERPGHQRHRRHQSRGAEAGRRARSPLQAGRPVGPAALHPDDRQGQLRDDRPAERQRLAGARRVRVGQGRVPGEADQGRRRDRARQVEHGGVGVHARTRRVSSILPGYTKNPYALDRVTAGSSGGTAAAVAASFGAVGLGSDTGNSIRGPSSHQALVGIRSTMGLTSRAGVMPLNLLADIAGPMARTVEDAVAVFQVDRRRGSGRSGRRPRRAAAPCRRTTRASLVARRAAGRAHRRAAPGLRARHDRSGDRRRCS